MSGRICIALAAIHHINTTCASVKEYDRRIITGRGTSIYLRDLPAMKALLDLCTDVSAVLEHYVRGVAAEFASDKVPTVGKHPKSKTRGRVIRLVRASSVVLPMLMCRSRWTAHSSSASASRRFSSSRSPLI
jgi:hypothetical protein